MVSTPLDFFLLQLMSTVQLTGEKIYDTYMVIHSATSTEDVSCLSRQIWAER